MKLKSSYSIDLSAQMAICDANFIRILKLLPDWSMGMRREISFAGNSGAAIRELDSAVTVIEVIESFKYTSTIKIKQLVDDDVDDVNGTALKRLKKLPHYQPPEILVRMYHDAKTAEVISYQSARFIKAKYPLQNEKLYQADEKEQVNFFLCEWLNYCLKEGLCSSSTLAENLPTRTAI